MSTTTTAMPELLEHQEIVKSFIIGQPHAGVFLGVGGGKTLTVLIALATIRPAGHILVVAPINIARSTWINEIEKWGIPLRTKSLIVNDNDKKLSRAKRLEAYAEAFAAPPTMYFINQDLVKDLVENMPTTRVNGKEQFQWPFPTVIIDESQGFKDPSANRFKAMKQARPAIIRLIELTGTPTPNGLLDLWAQVYLLDQGLALGTSFSAYKAKYFIVTRYANNRPIAWELKYGAAEEIYARVQHLVMSTENTAVSMPDVSIEDVNVTLDKSLMDAYKKFKKELVLDLVAENPGQPVHTIVALNQAVLTNKLVQFASGTLYIDDKKNYRVLHDNKIQMADYLIRNTPGSVLIAHMFRSDRAELLSKLAALGHDVQAFDGSRSMLQEWNEGKIGVLLIHPASAGHGLNFQDGGNTLIWYTLPYSLEHYIQTNGRLARMGQKFPVTIHRLITKGTHDARLPVSLARKARTMTNLLDAVAIAAIDDFDDLDLDSLIDEFSDLDEVIF